MAGRGRPFERGNQVGRGRPPGSRNKSGHRHEELLLEYAEALTRKMLSEALKGDKQSLRFCLERVLPARRERLVRMPAPKIATAEDMLRAAGNVWKRMFKGECTPGEAEKMIAILERGVRLREAEEWERRLERLEERHDAP